KAHPSRGELTLGPLVAIEVGPHPVGGVGTELDEAGTPLRAPEVEAVFGSPPARNPLLSLACRRARPPPALLDCFGQVRAGTLLLGLPLTEAHEGDLLLG